MTLSRSTICDGSDVDQPPSRDVTYLPIPLVPEVPLLDTDGMSLDAVVVVFALALLGGWYGHRLVTATQDVKAARNRLKGALGAVWKARRIALLVGAAIAVAADVWMRKHGG